MINLAAAFISGILLILVFPKFSMYYLAYVALVPLLISIRHSKTPKEAFLCGSICGAVFFGGALLWINILSKWAGLWANLAWFALTIFQALFIAAFALLFKLSLDMYPRFAILFAPLLWAFLEWMRSLGPYGVTGGGLSYSQTDFIYVLQLARTAGSYGISFLVVLVNESVAEFIAEKRSSNLVAALLIFALVITAGYYRINTFKGPQKVIKVAVIQANISQDVKLDFGYSYEIVKIHESMSRMALRERPDIVIWPETAVTTYLFETRSMLAELKKLVKESGSYFLIGTPFRERDRIYNSLASFSRTGEALGRYDKQRLVPFGEYLPFRGVFYPILGENPLFAEDYNGNPSPKVIDLGIVKVGAVICFESTFPYLVRDRARSGAQFILVVTNDAWFFDSPALYQHLQSSRMRAVESNMYVVQAANTGISAIIDPLGHVVKRSDPDQAAVLVGNVYFH